MAKDRRSRGLRDKGRGFYETSSPFETYEPGAGKPKTYKGYADENVAPDIAPRRTGSAGGAATDLAGPEVSRAMLSHMQADQYDNPRGFPGLALVTTGKSKLPMNSKHSIMHSMEGEAQLAGTVKGKD